MNAKDYMNKIKAVIVSLILCTSFTTQTFTRALDTIMDCAWLSLGIGITSFELNRLEQSIKQLQLEEANPQTHPQSKYNLEVLQSNVVTTAGSSLALLLVCSYALLNRPGTIGYNFVRLALAINIVSSFQLVKKHATTLHKNFKEVYAQQLNVS